MLFSIPAVRGVEFGTGFAAAAMYGSAHNDAILDNTGKTRTNHAGGVVGGISNGNELVFRLAVKPTSSTSKTQHSLNWETGTTEDFSIKGRHDLCVALRAPGIGKLPGKKVFMNILPCLQKGLSIVPRKTRSLVSWIVTLQARQTWSSS